MDSLRGLSRFRPHERLRSSSDYAKVKQEGKRRRTRHFGVNFAPNGLAHHRLGLIVQKRYWNAVQRNRIKRRIREWFRLHKNEIPHPFLDIVLIARPGAEKCSLEEIAIEIMSVFDGGNISGS
jgi:ribonuclease P protein component